MNAVARGLRSLWPAAPLILRLGVGITMAWHGWQKIDGGISNFEGFVDSLGIPAPGLVAYVVTALEFAGGIMLVAGLLTRLPALLIAIEMALAGFWIKATELQTGFIATEGTGYELDWILLAAAVAVAILGPGKISLDYMIGIDTESPSIDQLPARRMAEHRAA